MRYIQVLAGVLAVVLPILSAGCAAQETASTQYADAQNELAKTLAAAESRTQANRAEFRALMVNPSTLADPAKVQRLIVLGMLDPDPEIAKNAPRIIAAMFSNAAAVGNQGVTQAQADRLAAALGVVSYGDTLTGMNERMDADRHIARIQAEAAMIVARAQASLPDNNQAKAVNLPGN